MIRVNFGALVLKSCLDEEENDSDDSLFQVCIWESLQNILRFCSIKFYFQPDDFCFLLKKKPEERQFYMKYKFELSDLRILYSLSSILI